MVVHFLGSQEKRLKNGSILSAGVKMRPREGGAELVLNHRTYNRVYACWSLESYP